MSNVRLGDNIVTNGDFSSGFTDWSNDIGSSDWGASGGMAMTEAGTSYGFQQSVALTEGSTYRCEARTGLDGGPFDLRFDLGGSHGSGMQEGTYNEDIVAGAGDYVRLEPGTLEGIFRGIVTEIIVREVFED